MSISLSPFALWKLDDVSGTTAADSHGATPRNGTHAASVQVGVVAQVNKGVTYDGSAGSHTDFGDVFDLDFNQSFSIAFWFKTAQTGSFKVAIGKFNTAGTKGWGVVFNLSGAVTLEMVSAGGNQLGVRTTSLFNDGVWRHCAIAHDGTGKAAGVKIYINGVSVALTTINDSLTASIRSATPPQFTFGGVNASSAFGYVGSLDDVAIFPGVLSADDADQIYDAGVLGLSLSTVLFTYMALRAADVPVAPQSIVGLHAWFRADLGVTKDGSDLVSAWANQGGTAPAGSSSGANQPTWVASGINGKNVIRFGGPVATDKISWTGWTAPGTSVLHAFFVHKNDADVPADTFNGWGDFNDGAVGENLYPFTDGIVYHGFGSTVRKTTKNPTLDLSGAHILEFVSRAGFWSLRLNGETLFDTTTNTFGWVTTPKFGQSGGAGSRWYDGDLAEIVMFDGELPFHGPDRAKLLRYFADRYAITLDSMP